MSIKIKAATVAALTTAALAAPAIVPAVASANSITTKVQRQYATQIANRTRLAGYKLTTTTFKCAADGGGYYSCYGTYTLLVGGRHYKYGGYVNVTPTRWYSTSNGTLIGQW